MTPLTEDDRKLLTLIDPGVFIPLVAEFLKEREK
jgi:hypothetical protein